MQDKYAPLRVRAALRQPVRPASIARTHKTDTKSTRSKKRSTKRQTVQIAGWVSRPIKAEVRRIAEQNGWSESKTIAMLVEMGLASTIGEQQAIRTKAIITDAIDRRMRERDARFAALLLRIAFDAGQTRFLTTNILGRQPGVTEGILKTNLDMSAKRAKVNIIHRSPQVEELMEALDKWLIDKPEEKHRE